MVTIQFEDPNTGKVKEKTFKTEAALTRWAEKTGANILRYHFEEAR